MAGDLDQLRQSVPDLVRLDPLSAEVRAWLDSELRSLIEAGAAAPDDVDELDHYRNIVSRLKRR